MKRVLTAVLAVALALGMAGCPRFEVTFPVTSQDFSINTSNQLVMVVRFNQDVDLGGLIPGTNVILDTENINNANITVSAGATPNEIVVISDDSIDTLLTFDPDGFFTLNLLSTGGNPVVSLTGTVLYEDFTHNYTLLG